MHGPKTILVLDRSHHVRNSLTSQLERYGYKVAATGSSPEALEILRGEKIDLLIAEVGAPGIGKRTLMEEMSSASLLKEIPVIVLATTEEVGDVATWINSGCDDFLLKPVNPRLLFQRVQSLVETNPRAYRRVPCNIMVEGTTGAEAVSGELREIGEGGAGLVLDRELETDDILKVAFTLPHRPGELVLGAEIIYVQKTHSGYLHGLRFIIIDKITREKIKQFVNDTLLSDT